ncbi:MAG: radical SAM protein [Candidatus Lokiarchaeota archaeon]|nr:radical SAM protein [Candidatus Lokiarchaeota archaeon]
MTNPYIIDNKITNAFIEAYSKSTYRIIGKNKHTAIKPCHWLEQKLMTGRNNRNCYKGIFGIESHRCLQNSPAMPFCNQQCVFCWRDTELGNLSRDFIVEPDEPKELVDEMIRHHQDIIRNHLPLRRNLENYEIMADVLYYMLKNSEDHSVNSLSKSLHISKNKIERAVNLLKNQEFIHPSDDLLKNYKLDNEISCCIDSREEVVRLINISLTTPDEIMQAHGEALEPNHAAISLDGEPFLYPKLGGLVKEFRDRNMTSFIVTNGTLPERIQGLSSFPTQLYITLPAPNKEIYKKLCRPMINNGWEKITQSLDLINSLSCRTVVRLTAVKNLNLTENYLDNYTKIIDKANPDFFEIKGFTLQARALNINKRLGSDKSVQYYFPTYEDLEELALKFEERSNFPLIYKNKASRDFLFAVNWEKDKNPIITKP